MSREDGRGTAEASNTCEHGDHPAPPNKRFCSDVCAACELAEHPGGKAECAGICSASAPPGEPKAVVNEKTTWHERFGNRWFEVVDHNEEVQAHCGRRETAQFLADSLNETDLTQRRASAKPEIEEYEGEDKIINTIARLTGKPGGASYEEVQSMRAMLRGRGTR